MSREVRGSSVLMCFGCPPGIRTPIERVRVASPTIERGGNRLKRSRRWWLLAAYLSVRGERDKVNVRRRFAMVARGLECVDRSLGETRMFERYTEKARRVIFFARYEASTI